MCVKVKGFSQNIVGTFCPQTYEIKSKLENLKVMTFIF